VIKQLAVGICSLICFGQLLAQVNQVDKFDLNLNVDFDYIPGFLDYDLVGDRLSCMEKTIPLNYNSRVYAFVNYFAIKDREYTRMVIKRATYYFPIFEKYLKKYGLPDELKYLSIIESGLNPNAVSRVGAVGLWQFMPYTGRSYKLHQDWYLDERRDPIKATEAAFKYMKQLYKMFGDWELVMAAYNSGPGNVRKAIRRSGYKKKFWEIYRHLPRETRSYVPQWVAIYYVMNYADELNLLKEDFEYPVEFDTINVSNFLNLEVLASQLNLCLDDLRKLNPAIKHNALPEDVENYPLRIPSEYMLALNENREVIMDSAHKVGKEKYEALSKTSIGSTYGRDKVAYRVKSGDVLGTIAQRYRVRISDIRKWNNLRSNLIRVGQRLNIWIYPGAKIRAVVVQSKPRIEQLENGKYYLVQPGDTLWDISRMFKELSIEKLKTLNNLKSNKITPGQKLLIES